MRIMKSFTPHAPTWEPGVPAQRAKAASADATRDLTMARLANTAVRRELYEPGLKSSNKFHVGRPRAEEWGRVYTAASAISAARRLAKASTSITVWQGQAQNCGELALAVNGWLSARGIASGYCTTAGDHAFALLGASPSDSLPHHIEDWPEHRVICDPWANISSAARDFPKLYAAKMAKWSEKGKLIQRGPKWVDPVADRLGCRQLQGPFELTRIEASDA